MNLFFFDHNGVHHPTETEAIAHDAGDNTLWIIAGSVIMAAVIYSIVRLLNRRQEQPQEAEEEQKL